MAQPNHADLNISLDSSNVRVSCRIASGWYSRENNLQDTDRASMADRLTRIKNILPPETTSIWVELVDPLAAPQNAFVAGEFANCMERTISEGSSLYRDLSVRGLKTILAKVNTLPDGSTLTINTDFAFFPWEILYPEEYNLDWPPKLKKRRPFDAKKLWGYRFVIDYNMLPTDEEGWEPPWIEHSDGAPFISLNVNPTIAKSFLDKEFHPIRFHQDFFQKRITDSCGELLQSGTTILDKLVGDDNSATIIYLYCHGSSSLPFDMHSKELLELDDGTRLTPDALNFEEAYLRGPVVFLNSCLSGVQSPLSFSSFHTAFRKKRAIGIIGTAIKIPAAFAAAFARKVIEAYLDSMPLGGAMYRLRRELVDRGNPLALFYSLQCPSYVTAPKGAGKP
jgi:hypothetical protein